MQESNGKIKLMANWSVVALVAFLACDSFAAGDFKKSTPERIEKGKVLYQANCTVCHGDNGDGNTPAGLALKPRPRNFATEKFLNKKGNTVEGIFDVITNGLVLEEKGKKKPTAMVAFKETIKSDEDRWNLAHFVKTLSK